MTELNIEHILLFFITAFLIYHLKCSCGDGFNVGIETNVPLCTNTHVTDWKPANEYGSTGCVCPNGMMKVQDGKKNLYRCLGKETVTQNFNVGIETNVPLCTNTHVTDWKPANEYGSTGCVCPNGMMKVQDGKKNLYRCQDTKTVTQNCENFFKKCMCEEKKHIGNFIDRYNTCIKKTPEGTGGCGAGWAECDWGDGTWRRPGSDDTKCKKKYGCE